MRVLLSDGECCSRCAVIKLLLSQCCSQSAIAALRVRLVLSECECCSQIAIAALRMRVLLSECECSSQNASAPLRVRVERGVTPKETHRDVEGAERHIGTKRRRETERDLENRYSREM